MIILERKLQQAKHKALSVHFREDFLLFLSHQIISSSDAKKTEKRPTAEKAAKLYPNVKQNGIFLQGWEG